MTPYYVDDLVTLYHGDAREIAPALTADVLVTDPPYGIAYSPSGGGTWGNLRRGRGGPPVKSFTGKDVVRGDAEAFDPAHLIALGLPSVIWGGNHFASRLPDGSRWLIWDKRDGNPSNDFADCEMAWTNLGGPARLYSHRWQGLVKDSERGQVRYHPTQKPVSVMVWTLGWCPEGTVLDPYMGSGTTLLAAKSLGRRAVGIEIEERYCERAALRCSQEVLGLVG